MGDGTDEAAAARRPTLVYPFDAAPEPGSGAAVQVAPGVLWLRMPLGGSLAFINVWALEDGDGWTIVDTGLRTEATAAGWRTAFSAALDGRPVKRVIATHMHPDHVGMAGWIGRKFGAPLWMSRLEYLTCRLMVADTGREAPEDGVRFFRAAGWGEAAIENYKNRFGGFGKGVYPLPDSYRRISGGEVIRIGDRDWRVVVGSGHSPEHACLYQPDLKVMISGDQVLPRISSNVSVFPTEPDADPLNDWLTSLARIKTLVPDDVLVLPAHNDPFYGLHARLDHLIRGHERSLTRLERSLAEPKRAIDVFGALFARPISGELLGMATGESLAHLNCLHRRGRARRETGADGVTWWEGGMSGIGIRPAGRGDLALIHSFIGELAEYEKMADRVVAAVEDIGTALFGVTPRAYCEIAELEGQPVGFALWFYNFSTFHGRAGIYLEDLYVRPEARGHGVGKALLAALARRCLDEGLRRMDWAVLDWNAPSIAFYDSLGADSLNDWITRRLSGDALERLAEQA